MVAGVEDAKPVKVLKTPLNASDDLVKPDMKYFLEQKAKEAEKRARMKENN
jgi:hypothetical protein